MDHEEFMFFLTGGVGLENKLRNPAPQWLSDRSWDEICRMCDLKAFKGTNIYWYYNTFSFGITILLVFYK